MFSGNVLRDHDVFTCLKGINKAKVKQLLIKSHMPHSPRFHVGKLVTNLCDHICRITKKTLLVASFEAIYTFCIMSGNFRAKHLHSFLMSTAKVKQKNEKE